MVDEIFNRMYQKNTRNNIEEDYMYRIFVPPIKKNQAAKQGGVLLLCFENSQNT